MVKDVYHGVIFCVYVIPEFNALHFKREKLETL